jgi:phage-related baseplate assembly protein
MPLPLPALDRLLYDELVAEGRGSLPALTPGWTDYNAHDPGITFLELFAWLAESDSYRLDRIPEESYRAFLRLVGVDPRPARVAQTALVFTTDAASAQVPSGTRVQSADGKTVFQTDSPLYVSDAQLRAVLCGAGGIFADLTVRNSASGPGFAPLGDTPVTGDALYLGFDRVLAPQDTEVCLWVWTGRQAQDWSAREKLQQEIDEVLAEKKALCPASALGGVPDWRQHYGVRTVWEYYAGNDQWPALKEVVDDTRALTLSGGVCFKAPGNHAKGLPASPAQQDKYFIRCRLAQGRYDCPPRCTYVALNAALARHAVDAPQATLHSNGRAAQRFVLAGKPVVPGSSKVTVTPVGGANEAWQESLAWDGAGPQHRSYVLAPDAGRIAFGDGRIGRVPPADATIAVHYQIGGGGAGNVPAQTLSQLPSGPAQVEVFQPCAAICGAPAETLNSAKARAVRELATPTRAVTLHDFEQLALCTPGAPVARAHAIADYDPAIPCVPVSGSVTVVVMPPCPDAMPVPTDALRAAVFAYVDRRRVLTAELHIAAPQYTIVTVSARLRARPDADPRAIVRVANAALETFFHPLRGGPDRNGWPIGRAVYRSELLAVLNGVAGVAYVEELAWTADGNAARCTSIAVCPHGLVASGIHEISVNEGNGCHE